MTKSVERLPLKVCSLFCICIICLIGGVACGVAVQFSIFMLTLEKDPLIHQPHSVQKSFLF